MNKSFKERLITSIRDAARYDSGNMVAPKVVLWPDPDKQWQSIIHLLQADMPELLIWGEYDPEHKTGPAIWLKCMVSRTLPCADWEPALTPVIYLPGISKNDLKNLANADPLLAPLMEYQYTGTLWLHRNGKEWTVSAFLQNKEEGMGLNLAQDGNTRDAGIKVLSKIFQEAEIHYPSHVNSDFLYQLLFENEKHSILEWMCNGDAFFQKMDIDKQQVFTSICKSRYGFIPNQKNIISIAEKLGMKAGNWGKVWDYYVLAPQRFPEVENLLESAKPTDMGNGLFTIPEDSRPQINANMEEELRKEMHVMATLSYRQAIEKVSELNNRHEKRRYWVWASLGRANLAIALKYLQQVAALTTEPYNAGSVANIRAYYEESGYKIDYAAIKALAATKAEKEKQAVKSVLGEIYKPWLEKLTVKFQELVSLEHKVFTDIEIAEGEPEFILFVDAFRYDIARQWADNMAKQHFRVSIETTWTPLPSLTATCKPFVSPVAGKISSDSLPLEFKPRTKGNKELTTFQFEAELDSAGYAFPKSISEISRGQKTWMEIGKIDQYGHDEQADLAYRIQDLFDLIEEKVIDIMAAGFRKIKIVTDHGWLLVPGGMPRENLPIDHIETRWGRCAILKDGVPSNLMHFPWYWNPNVMIAYAPGISFFKANNEYAHGGISLQECLVPIITIESDSVSWQAVSMDVKWTGLKCTLEIKGAQPGYKVEIRTKHTDEGSLISKTKEIGDGERVSLFVENSDLENTAAFIVITDNRGVVVYKHQTIVGE